MPKRTGVFILAGGKAEGLMPLTRLRAKTSLPFGGKYRVIDFTLSNCVHSNLYSLNILAQYNPQSLLYHIRLGKPWDLDRMRGGVRIYQPYAVKDGRFWYQGTADAIHQNIELVDSDDIDDVLVLSGDQVYKMDYSLLLYSHRRNPHPITIGVVEKPLQELSLYGVVQVDGGEKVIDFIEKPEDEIEGYASMGLYLFDKDYLLSLFSEKNKNPPVDIVYDIIIPAVERSEVGYYIHRGYWQDIGTLHRYYKANMDLLEDFPELNLHDRGWQILTRMKDEPPIRFIEDSESKGSLICDGSIIKGRVVNSIISPSVIVERGASVENSIIYENSTIKEGARIKDSIIDKLVYVGESASIGYNEVNELKPYQEYGLTVIGKGTRIPDDFHIGSGCTLDIFLTEGDFKEDCLSSGNSIILTDDEAKNRGEHLLQLENL